MLAAPNRPGRDQSRVWRTIAWAVVALAISAAALLCISSPVAATEATAEPAPPAASGALSPQVAVGATEPFWCRDWNSYVDFQINATARYVGEHCVVWVHDKALFHDALVNQLGTSFDMQVYPAITAAYGSEPNPGIDGDPRISILVYDFKRDSIDGAFNHRDIDPGHSLTSNRREMFYLNLQALIAEPKNMGALAAHELAHLVVYYRDVMLDPSSARTSEPNWILEGLCAYAEHLAGFSSRVDGQLQAFTNDPSLSLTLWMGLRANYGASYAFIRYLAERQGPDFMRALVGEPLDGKAGINATLRNMGAFATFDTLFDDWIVANYLDGRPPTSPPYAYSGIAVSAKASPLSGPFPLLGDRQARDFAAVYLEFPATSREAVFQAVIDGADRAPLEAALLSWDSEGVRPPSVRRFDLNNPATAGTVSAPPGFDRHTLAVWARGTVGSTEAFAFRYSGAPDPPGGVQFLDVGGSDHYYQYIAELLTRGIISGREAPAGSGLWIFAGKENVTRGQFAKMIMGTIGRHTPEIEQQTPSFKDVPASHTFYDYIEEAVALGIVQGFSDGTFKPSSAITRSQLVLMIHRAAQLSQPLPDYEGGQKFVDVIPSHPRYREIMAAYGAEIMSGSPAPDGRLFFYPDSPASRNHVAKMTAQFCGHLDP